MLGYQGNSDWRDMSEYLVHLTDEQGFAGILQSGTIVSGNPYGTARKHPELGKSQYAVCLSEIPLDYLQRLAQRRGCFGIGFLRAWVRQRGGAPIAYWPRGSAPALAFQQIVNEAMRGGIDPEDPVWGATPFVDNPGAGNGWTYDFIWEREHRVVGDLEFTEQDVVFLFLPEQYHEAWSKTLDNLDLPQSFQPPLLDIKWPMQRLQEEVKRADL
ncbi:hypothetical protein [Actinomadura rupiterrae]|uniref:hypothetical protein n=1 Tax=Actinomadura rupiterrae TaxID=559627 RepID=UPI0020A51C78|nr:hypothetical protein [Actinomadura rupiterrae]MCP2342029.1 hypothetical protein [Actinomadura rupiterrae]